MGYRDPRTYTATSRIIFNIICSYLCSPPPLTGKPLSEKLGNIHLILWTVGGLIMGLSMGLAGTLGMLRRTLYPMGLGPYEPYMMIATMGALIMAAAFIVFIINIMRTVKLENLLKILFQNPTFFLNKLK